MRDLPRVAGDALLGLFAVVVVISALVAVHDSTAPVSSSLRLVPASTPTPRPSPVASPSPTKSPESTARPGVAQTVVLAGPDLTRLQYQLAARTGDTVDVVDGGPTDVLAPHVLDTVTGTPRAVVLEVLAGTKTSVRTATAIAAVRARWAHVEIIVIGPFSSADRKSAAAVEAAAAAANVVFLDPVALKWRRAAGSATLTAADLTTVTDKLAAALA